MIKAARLRKVTLGLTIAAILLIPTQAQAKPQSFHIKHSNYSQVNGGVRVFTGSACQPATQRKATLHRGQKVKQNGYDSFTVPGREFHVTVHHWKTGQEIAYRAYGGDDCVRAYIHDYSIRIFEKDS